MAATPDAPPCLACGARAGEPWCVARDAEYRATDETFSYLRCRSCGVLYIDPVPRDRLAEIYPANYYSFAAPGRSPVQRAKQWLDARRFRALLAGLPGMELAVLDVGGGTGWQLDALRALDPRIRFTQVVDLDPGAQAAARAAGHAYFCGPIEAFASERRFALILMLNLIEHVDDPGAVLAKAAALLAPGGAILVKTPNWDALDARLFRHRNWAGYHCPRHWVLFTKESLLPVLARAGLRARAFAYTQGAPFWAASALGWLADKGLVRVTRERPVVCHPLFGPLAALFAAFDLLRAPFGKTSQMFLTLERAGSPAA